MRTLTQFRSFERPVQLLLLNQLTINIGFYMLIPYLAAYLSGELGLAIWIVGLVLGVRNFSQQGMFLLGGTLADRLGYKPLIVAGCALRTGGFALLGLVDSVPALIVAAAATGFAGALFNPAVRAYLAHDAGERRVEAFALFNIFYQTGILLGPLIGLALTGIDFRLTCLAAAGVFAVLTVLQLRSLPQRSGPGCEDPADRPSVLADWRTVLTNRSFLLFSTAMIGTYVLMFQVYLALPLEVRRLTGSGFTGTTGVAALFATSGLLTIAGQLRITAWCRQHWGPGRCLALGLTLMGAAFLPPLLTAHAAPSAGHPALLLAPLVISAAVLAIGTIIVFPFEMNTIVTLAGNRLVATYYGLYNTICGIGILAGNVLTGAALDLGRTTGFPALPWLGLAALGLAGAAAVAALDRADRLRPAERTQPAHT